MPARLKKRDVVNKTNHTPKSVLGQKSKCSYIELRSALARTAEIVRRNQQEGRYLCRYAFQFRDCKAPCDPLVICPTGKSVTAVDLPVSSPICKNIPLSPSGKSSLQIRASRPERGALAIVANVGAGRGGRKSVGRANVAAGRAFGLVSGSQRADERRFRLRYG